MIDDPQNVEALVNVTLAIGGIVIALLTGIAGIAWRLSSSLTKRDLHLRALGDRLDEHEAECVDRYAGISERIKNIDERGAKMAQSISRIEGYIEAGKR